MDLPGRADLQHEVGMFDLGAAADHWPVIAAIYAVGWTLRAVIVIWGLTTRPEGRRQLALDMLRVLKPGVLPQKSDAGSS